MLRHEPQLLGDKPLGATLIAGGRSNLTYALEGTSQPLVLRRPPLGHVQATAHDMQREFRVISALETTGVPVPRAVLFVDDAEAGVDVPFYLMQKVDGRTLTSRKDNVGYDASQLRELSFELVRTLARVQSIAPTDVGLGDFGHPVGFLTRQVARWGTQYDGSRNRSLPELDELQQKLRGGIPETQHSSILHGDYRLDNALVNDFNGTPQVSAILDWEMATLGDSLTDLGLLGLYWNVNNYPDVPRGAVPSSVWFDDGYPSFDELVDEYCATLGMSVPELPWYLAMAAFKLAVILEGIHYRYQAGQTVGAGFDQIGQLVTPLARTGLRYLDGH